MELGLKILSGLCWTCVYVAAIRVGWRDRTYALPAFALGLNLVWEILYFSGGLLYWRDYDFDIHAQTVVNAVWAVLDIAIFVTLVRFGRREWPELTRLGFGLMITMILAVSICVQFAFLWQFGPELGARYSAFAQNLLMSVLFISLLLRRATASGQSNVIAVGKLIGTLAPTLSAGFIGGFSPFIAVTGLTCLVLDVVYLVLLNAVMRPAGRLGDMVGWVIKCEPEPRVLVAAT